MNNVFDEIPEWFSSLGSFIWIICSFIKLVGSFIISVQSVWCSFIFFKAHHSLEQDGPCKTLKRTGDC